jgi:hypothetical protein
MCDAKNQGVAAECRPFLVRMLFRRLGGTDMIAWNYPQTVEEAVEQLISEMPLKDRVFVAGLDPKQLFLVEISLGSYVRQNFGLWTGNTALIDSCRAYSGHRSLTADQGAAVILEALWKTLRETHTLRLIKD